MVVCIDPTFSQPQAKLWGHAVTSTSLDGFGKTIVVIVQGNSDKLPHYWETSQTIWLRVRLCLFLDHTCFFILPIFVLELYQWLSHVVVFDLNWNLIFFFFFSFNFIKLIKWCFFLVLNKSITLLLYPNNLLSMWSAVSNL